VVTSATNKATASAAAGVAGEHTYEHGFDRENSLEANKTQDLGSETNVGMPSKLSIYMWNVNGLRASLNKKALPGFFNDFNPDM